jgi:hypothetical protein
MGDQDMVTTFSKRNCDAVSVLQSFTGDASTDLVKYLVEVMMYLSLYLLAGG